MDNDLNAVVQREVGGLLSCAIVAADGDPIGVLMSKGTATGNYDQAHWEHSIACTPLASGLSA
jgi:hypothetical protein